MKCVILCVLGMVAMAYAATNAYPRGCIWVMGHCHRECPEGTHGYATGCGPLMPEATCKEPNPVLDARAHICDFSACYCDPPTVKDQATGKCVKMEDCTKDDGKEAVKEEVKQENAEEKKEAVVEIKPKQHENKV